MCAWLSAAPDHRRRHCRGLRLVYWANGCRVPSDISWWIPGAPRGMSDLRKISSTSKGLPFVHAMARELPSQSSIAAWVQQLHDRNALLSVLIEIFVMIKWSGWTGNVSLHSPEWELRGGYCEYQEASRWMCCGWWSCPSLGDHESPETREWVHLALDKEMLMLKSYYNICVSSTFGFQRCIINSSFSNARQLRWVLHWQIPRVRRRGRPSVWIGASACVGS